MLKMEYIPGVIAYFTAGFLVWTSKVFVWKIADHWSKIWVGNTERADSQVLSLTFVITALIVFGFAVFIWSIANHINYKNTEKGFIANMAGGMGIALAVSQDIWLNELAAKLPYTS